LLSISPAFDFFNCRAATLAAALPGFRIAAFNGQLGLFLMSRIGDIIRKGKNTL
jgi:hypothetical protein